MTCLPPVISVLCVTYRHEKFIRQALDGFVSQRVDVPFEVLVGDDCSPDGTAAIVQEYSQLYPHIIRPVLHTTNLGAAKNLQSLVQRLQGRYVTMCDGDDYWTDPLKLQKQFDYLEAHSDYALCFHKVRQFYEDGSQPDVSHGPGHYLPDVVKMRDYFVLGDLLRINVIASLSVMYRWKLGNALPSWMLQYGVCDLPMHLLHADTGKIGYIDEIMGAYRKHSGGSWWQHENLEHRRANLSRYIALLEDVHAHLDNRHKKEFDAVFRILNCEKSTLEPATPSPLAACISKGRRWLSHFRQSWFS